MRSIYDNTKIDGIVAAFNTSVALLAVGGSVDTKGYNTAALRLATSAVGAGIIAAQQISVIAVLEESADNVTFTAALDNTGTQIKTTASATTSAVLASARIEGLGQNRLRYLRVKTTGGQFTAGVIAQACTSVAVLELGRAFQLPTTTAASNT